MMRQTAKRFGGMCVTVITTAAGTGGCPVSDDPAVIHSKHACISKTVCCPTGSTVSAATTACRKTIPNNNANTTANYKTFSTANAFKTARCNSAWEIRTTAVSWFATA
ncbi:hypothetical protein C7N83_09820 [Neisseria iguanae]|uniref:Uncharacterized protein n=1 Tax=Neisseria iguanae TaxID=90242 RepID=A0A2P7TYQ3_9NEIS|nr:hypothetical protein C7N83_09820 [Neisseria iguanae]